MISKSHPFVPTPAPTHSHPMSDPNPERELFGAYFESWLGEQARDLDSLIASLNSAPESTRPGSESTRSATGSTRSEGGWTPAMTESTRSAAESTRSETESTRSVSELVGRVMHHYENYYRVKAESVRRDAVRMMSPAWRSHLEDAFLWIGGWRPSMAFHLLYSVSGLQLEAGITELLSGLSTGDLADLSPGQLDRVNELQKRTIKEEKALTETLAAHQETVADSSMVELAHLATESARSPDSVSRRVNSELAGKEEKLESILCGADELRLRTLKDVVNILSPVQAAHFLIAAAELHLRVHEWGKKRDGYANGDGRPNNGVSCSGSGPSPPRH